MEIKFKNSMNDKATRPILQKQIKGHITWGLNLFIENLTKRIFFSLNAFKGDLTKGASLFLGLNPFEGDCTT